MRKSARKPRNFIGKNETLFDFLFNNTYTRIFHAFTIQNNFGNKPKKQAQDAHFDIFFFFLRLNRKLQFDDPIKPGVA